MKYIYQVIILLAALSLFVCGMDGMMDLLTEQMLTSDERGVAVIKCALGYVLAGYITGVLACWDMKKP